MTNEELRELLAHEHADPKAAVKTWPGEEPIGAFIHNGTVYVGSRYDTEGLSGGTFIGQELSGG